MMIFFFQYAFKIFLFSHTAKFFLKKVCGLGVETMGFRGRKCAVYGSKLWGLGVKTMGLLYRKPPDTTDNRQRTTVGRWPIVDSQSSGLVDCEASSLYTSILYLPLCTFYTFSTLHTAKPPLYTLSLRFIFFINCLKNIDKHNFYIPKWFLTKTH